MKCFDLLSVDSSTPSIAGVFVWFTLKGLRFARLPARTCAEERWLIRLWQWRLVAFELLLPPDSLREIALKSF